MASRQGSAVPSLPHLMNSSTVTALEKPRRGRMPQASNGLYVLWLFSIYMVSNVYISANLYPLSLTHMEKALYNFSVTVQH